MRRAISVGLVLTAFLIALAWGTSVAVFAAELKFLSEQTMTGFAFPESVAYDPGAKVLYVSQFGYRAETRSRRMARARSARCR